MCRCFGLHQNKSVNNLIARFLLRKMLSAENFTGHNHVDFGPLKMLPSTILGTCAENFTTSNLDIGYSTRFMNLGAERTVFIDLNCE